MPLPGTGPISLGNLRAEFGLTGPVSLANVKNWGAAQHGAGVSLANFRGVSAGLWAYPPPGMPQPTSWAKPATLVNNVRYVTANVTTAPYANGPWNGYLSVPWYAYVDATANVQTLENSPAGLLYFQTSADPARYGYCGSNDPYYLSSTADSAPVYFSVDLPYAVAPFAYKLIARYDSNPEQAPSKWTLEASADRAGWTTVDSQAGVTNWVLGASNHFALARSTRKYQYWRLGVTRNNNATPGVVTVSKIVLYCPEQPVVNITAPSWTTINAPKISPTGGYNGGAYVGFSAGSSQYAILASTLTANVATNGGFTAVALVSATGTPGTNERVFDLADYGGSNNIILRRNSGNPAMTFSMQNGTGSNFTVSGGTLAQDTWNLWTARYFAANTVMQLYQNEALAAAAAGTAVTDRTTGQNYVAKSTFGTGTGAYSNLRVKALAIWDRALSDADLATANVYFRDDVGWLPEGAIATFSAAALQMPVIGNLSSTRTTLATFQGVNSPTTSATGGYNNGPVVDFSAPKSQYAMTVAPVTFQWVTNGGWTVMALARFTGVAGNNERIFDFGSNSGSYNSCFLARNGTSTAMNFIIYRGSTAYGLTTASGVITQGTWNLWTVRYYSSGVMQLYQDGVQVGNVTISPVQFDRTNTTNYVGRSNVPTDAYSNVQIKTLVMWDRALSDAELATADTYVKNDTGALPANTLVTFTYTSMANVSTPTGSITATAGSTLSNGVTVTWTAVNTSNAALSYGLGASPGSYATYATQVSPATMSNVFAANTVYTIQAVPAGFAGTGVAATAAVTTPQLVAANLAALYLKAVSNAVPASDNLGNPLTVVGNASSVLDPTRGYVLSLSAGGLLNTAVPPGNSYTKAAWVYATADPGANAVNVLSSTTGSPGHYLFLNAGVLSAGQDTSALNVCVADPAGIFPSNAWVHVAYTYNKTANTAVLYRNGLAVASNTAVAAWTAGATTPVSIGGYGNASSWTGYLDDVRVYSAALSAAQIQQLQAPSLATTDPLWANVVFRATFDWDWNDYKNGYIASKFSPGTGTISFATPAPTGLGGAAVRFSPTNTEGVAVRYTGSAFNLGTGPVTIEFWAYFDAVPTKGSSMLSSHNGAYTPGSWFINYDPSYRMTMGVYSTTAGNNSGFGASLAGSTWYHICCMRIGAGLYVLVNGAPYASNAAVINTTDFMGSARYPGTTYGMDVGCNGSFQQAFYGRIDDVRISNVQRYPTTGFVPPTAPLPRG
jgi:hypothetical protein